MARPSRDPYRYEATKSPFREIRLNVKLSQEQLAREIGVVSSTIRRWEKGETEPTMTVKQMKEFCRSVGRKLDDLPDSFLFTSSNTSKAEEILEDIAC